jgi:hypothetical protein
MCYECGDVFHNIAELPTFEEFDLEAKRGHAFEFTPRGISRRHEASLGTHDHYATAKSGRTAQFRRHERFGTHTPGHAHGGRATEGPRHYLFPVADGGVHVPTRVDEEPRYPHIEIGGYDDLLEVARTLMDKPRVSTPSSESGELEHTTRPGAGYDISHGEYERVLLVAEENYDAGVYNAIAQALRERGAAVDIATIQRFDGPPDVWEDGLPGVHVGKPDGHPLLPLPGVRWWEDIAESRRVRSSHLRHGRPESRARGDGLPAHSVAD